MLGMKKQIALFTMFLFISSSSAVARGDTAQSDPGAATFVPAARPSGGAAMIGWHEK